MSTHDGRRHGILAIDTATSRALIATGTPDGVIDGLSTWVVGYRHGETLLPTIGRFLGEQNLRRSRLVGIVAGTGPGAFTGLRVGLATAKGLAHGLGIPLVGVSTAAALLHAAGPGAVLLQPAGPRDRVLSRPGAAPELLTRRHRAGPRRRASAWSRWTWTAGPRTTRWPWAPRPGTAWARPSSSSAPRACAALGDDRRGELETLVPEYVTLPRGVAASSGEVSWSRDPR